MAASVFWFPCEEPQSLDCGFGIWFILPIDKQSGRRGT